MTTTTTPVESYLDAVASIAPTVEREAAASESAGRLTEAIVRAFHDAGLPRLTIPRRFEGGGLSNTEAMQIYEALARVDGAAGWCAAIGSGAGTIGAWLEPATFEELVSQPGVVLCGSLNPLLTRAIESPDANYTFTGKGTYGSGLFYATHVLLGSIVFEGEQPRMLGGGPEVRGAIVERDKVRSLDTWSVSGLKATGSTDFEFESVAVPQRWTFLPREGRYNPDGSRGVLDLMSSLGGALAAVMLGIAQHALDIVIDVAGKKTSLASLGSTREKPSAQIAIARAEGLLLGARALVYGVAEELEALEASGEPMTNQIRARNRVAMITASDHAAQAVDLAWEIAGGGSIFVANGLERCWRDIHTATQHTVFDRGRYVAAGGCTSGSTPLCRSSRAVPAE